jgi:hypothetical protein
LAPAISVTNKVVGIAGGKKPDECLFCDGEHSTLKCPRVLYLELFEDGSISAVEFVQPKTLPYGDETP